MKNTFVGRPSKYTSRIVYTSSIEKELYERFKEVAWRERKPMNVLIQEFMKKYIKEHGEGNPLYQIDKWIENPELIATPAFFEDIEKWKAYVKRIDDPKELDKHTIRSRYLQAIFKRRNEDIERIGRWKADWNGVIPDDEMSRIIDES